MVLGVFKALNRHPRDPWFLDEYTLNPYNDCTFGCLYCYARGSRYGKEGFGVKKGLIRALVRELHSYSRRGMHGFIALGSATEPWMQPEESLGITRKCLGRILEYRFPVHCLTKSTLILRDAGLLREISESAILPEDLRGLEGAYVTFSFLTLNASLARLLEPGAPRPDERLNAARELMERGLRVGLAFMPIILALTEGEMEEMASVAAELGVNHVYFSPMTLEPGSPFRPFLRERYPEAWERIKEIYGSGRVPSPAYNREFFRRVRPLLERHRLRFGIAGSLP